MTRSIHTAVVLSVLLVAACDSGSGDDAPIPMPEELTLGVAEGSGEPNLAAGGDSGVVASWVELDDQGYLLRFATLAGKQWSAARTVARGADWFSNWADLPSVVPITADTWAAHWLVNTPDSFGAYDIYTAVSRDSGTTWSAPSLPCPHG